MENFLQRIISANLNGIRSAHQKGFFDWLASQQADVVCVQELKAQHADLTERMRTPDGLQGWFHCAEKKGYSGTAVYYKSEPLAIRTGLSNPAFNNEGRTIIMEYPDFILYNVYFPNGQKDEQRLAFKMDFNRCIQNDVQELLSAGKNVIVCGDINIAHREIDLKNPKTNRKNAGFTDEERQHYDFDSLWKDAPSEDYSQNKNDK